MPDGTQLPLLSADQFGIDPVSIDWRVEPPTHSRIADQARAAELVAENAIQTELARVQRQTAENTRDPADPLDQVAADWAASINADEKIIHAFLGIDDPVGREAQNLFTDLAVEIELSAFLETLPEGKLARGELAALSAFDDALASGADAEEALSAAINAAETGRIDGDETGVGVNTASKELPETPVEKNEDILSAENNGTGEEIASETGVTVDDFAPPLARPSFLGLPGLGVGGSVLLDSAFGFGFSFTFDSTPIFKPGSTTLSQRDRNEDNENNVVDVSSNSVIQGTSFADLLIGTSINDTIGSQEGDDFVYTDTPTNYDSAVHTISAPLSNPTFSASGGDDIAAAGSGDDSIWGGAGNDQLHGDVPEQSSSLYSEFSFPLGLTTGGNDMVDGGDGNDTLWGGAGDDTLIGGAGTDTLYGDAGGDSLSGGAGDDNLFGYAGDDIIIGGDEADTLVGGEGADELTGGYGADRFEFSGSSGASAFDHAQSLGTDTIYDYAQADNDTFALADADFALGKSGTLTDGIDYFETTTLSLSGIAQDMSGGSANAGVVVVGSNDVTDTGGVAVYYTDNAAAMTNLNSYQIADVISVNATDMEAGDFFLY